MKKALTALGRYSNRRASDLCALEVSCRKDLTAQRDVSRTVIVTATLRTGVYFQVQYDNEFVQFSYLSSSYRWGGSYRWHEFLLSTWGLWTPATLNSWIPIVI